MHALSRMADKYPMTKKGLTTLKEELKHRKEVERFRIVRAIEEARAHGDISENAEFSAAKEAQSHNCLLYTSRCV